MLSQWQGETWIKPHWRITSQSDLQNWIEKGIKQYKATYGMTGSVNVHLYKCLGSLFVTIS